MLIQKLYKNGNSVAVTIPKEYLNNLNLEEGSEVVVEQDPEAGSITISRKKKVKPASKLSPAFLKWLNAFNKQYESALKELAKR
ncbi:AbrB/MazE/SpoVT family DNA-binding domain-containing protein [Candidatus Daviesbacteria bacterium]|nr:AbrB/MazE/SpoVT family DNA-binding domain-containing protein [Candidatus Daviesbacteria bacterium]